MKFEMILENDNFNKRKTFSCKIIENTKLNFSNLKFEPIYEVVYFNYLEIFNNKIPDGIVKYVNKY